MFYNPAVYETCPIENWWELTEPEWKDNVYMNSPLRSYPAYALFYAVMEHSDLMAAAYEERYGVALEVPKGSSAGKIFWEKLVDNGLGFTTSSNEAVELVGTGGQENPPMVFMISSKIRRSEVGLQSAVAYGVEPCDGVYSSNTISIAGGAENINSAKLFIRWLLGETDGTGEGIGPYMLEGTWPVRTDLKNPSPVDLKDGTIWFTDKQKIGDAEDEILEFWESLQKK